ncbi:hypothetical protein NHX12_005562 [Muraenolepis orangiensis]|uniref:Ephrin RBD domain-containing protein n=1 Tax=Muraenolepis orangiensis TaxID=630683 RepID=A0A9Q0DRN5_9TELE|nr:hypothetical protein NHX12_005562 [Muraenolepis orangiensis]
MCLFKEPEPDTTRLKSSLKTKQKGSSSGKTKSRGQAKVVPLTRSSIVSLEKILDLSMLTCLHLNRRNKEEVQKHLNILKNRLVGACAELRVPPVGQRDFEVSPRRLQEESRLSLDGKKTLGRMEAQLNSLVPSGKRETTARLLGEALLTSEPLQDARHLLATAGHCTDLLLSDTGPSDPIGDKIDIVCPGAGVSGGVGPEEFYRVYLVTLAQLHSCSVDQTHTPLLTCDRPQQEVKFTLKFQEFSPNLWGLEFLRGRDYYVTSTSTGSLQGLGNPVGGVCRSRSMSMVLRVGQSPSDPPSPPQESPTRFPPKRPAIKNKESTGPAGEGEDGWDGGVLVGVVSGSVVLVLTVGVLGVCVRRRSCCRHSEDRPRPPPPPSSLPLRRLAQQDGGEDPDPRDQPVFPPHGSDDAFCRHYRRISGGDYGAPVYIVQEVPPPSPTHIYYKV